MRVDSLSEIPELPVLHSHVSFRPALQQLQLHKQRRETAALRELWHSFSNKRRNRRQEELRAQLLERGTLLKPSSHTAYQTSTTKTGKEPSQEADPSSRLATADADARQGETSADITTKRPQLPYLPAISVSTGNATAVLLHRQPLKAQRRNNKASPASNQRGLPAQGGGDAAAESATAKKFFRRGCTDVSHHTAITRRPSRAYSPKFRALTQLWSSPLPQLMEEVASTDQGSLSRDIREWQNEIVKVVPTRPEFVQSLPSGKKLPKVKSSRYPYKIVNTDPSCHFARSFAKVTDKDYVISPEWASEKSLFHPGIGSRTNTDVALVKKIAY